MTALPAAFVSRMQAQLGAEYPAFAASYDLPPRKGLRVNTLKISPDRFAAISPFPLQPVSWEPNGFAVAAEKIGSHPYHAAGLYYSQEPSAMAPAPLLDVQEGERVLDLCAAPGGKGTRLAEAAGETGLAVLNECVYARAKILLENAERLGLKNAVVLSEAPARLAERFPAYFDKILVDAPCSGEGMFKKNAEEALAHWSEENVRLCAARQRDILSAAAKMLKGGGKLVYSTCTFSEEEDEGQVRDFLRSHGDFVLLREEKLYPHRVAGEGHYAALLQKTEGEQNALPLFRPALEKSAETEYRAFERDFTSRRLSSLYRAGDGLYALPEGLFDFKGLNLLRAGVKAGEFAKNRFVPAHAFAMSLKREECLNFVSLSQEEAARYLRGEVISFPAANGWCVVGAEDYPLGLGKASSGAVKNHYPKNLRKKE